MAYCCGPVGVNGSSKDRWSVAVSPHGVFGYWLRDGRHVSSHEQGMVSHHRASEVVAEMLDGSVGELFAGHFGVFRAHVLVRELSVSKVPCPFPACSAHIVIGLYSGLWP